MARFILIDNCSGYIFGDTADFMANRQSGASPTEAARALDESIGEHGRAYEEVGRRELASNETGYHVYRADVGGSDAVATVENGQDRETIDAVLRDCEYVTTLRCSRAEEAA